MRPRLTRRELAMIEAATDLLEHLRDEDTARALERLDLPEDADVAADIGQRLCALADDLATAAQDVLDERERARVRAEVAK